MGIGGSRRDEEYRVTFTTEMAERLERHAHAKDLFVSSLIREVVECWVIDEDKRVGVERPEPKEPEIEDLQCEIESINGLIASMRERKREITDKLRKRVMDQLDC